MGFDFFWVRRDGPKFHSLNTYIDKPKIAQRPLSDNSFDSVNTFNFSYEEHDISIQNETQTVNCASDRQLGSLNQESISVVKFWEERKLLRIISTILFGRDLTEISVDVDTNRENCGHRVQKNCPTTDDQDIQVHQSG